MLSSMRCCGVKVSCHVNFNEKANKAHRGTISKRIYIHIQNKKGISELPPLPFSFSLPGQTPPRLNHKVKPQMTNRFQTPCFSCQNAEFRLFDKACAVTSLAPLPTPRPSCRRGAADELSIWPWGSPEYCRFVFTSTLNMTFQDGPKTTKLRSALMKWTFRTEQGQTIVETFCGIFFFSSGLVIGAAAAPNPHRKAFIWDWF